MYEIERKFLLNCDLEDVLRDQSHTKHQLTQCYMADSGDWTIRARQYDSQYFLTLKMRETDRTSREIETEIDRLQYEVMESMSVSALSKTRHVVFHDGDMWEIDLFEDGLVIAEIELTHEEEEFEIPKWIGREVTHDRNYRSKKIAQRLTTNS